MNAALRISVDKRLWSRGYRRVWKRLSRLGFEFSLSHDLSIRREVHAHASGSFRAIYASDLHLHPASEEFVIAQLNRVIDEHPFNLMLLGGDLVDSRTSLPTLSRFILRCRERAPVLVVPGNHDVAVGLEAVQHAVESAGGQWLPGNPFTLTIGERPMTFVGSFDHLPLVAKRDGTVLVGHDPSVFPEAAKRGVSLVLAGHTHGGQFVWWRWRGKMYPGAFGYRWNGERFSDGSTTLLVSRGVVDLIPIRFRCPREVLCIEL
jgi:uncharacterized protein